jgi:6,7-dimethyl-8-ribityllumazine synthase
MTPEHQVNTEQASDGQSARLRIGIVRALYHEDKTERMLEIAENEADERGMEVSQVLEVPGAHDVALAAKRLLKNDGVDGIVILGIVVKGATDHDEVIAHNISKQLMELSCKYEKPVGFGIMGPNISWAEAEDRIESYAMQAVDAVYDTHQELRKLQRL